MPRPLPPDRRLLLVEDDQMVRDTITLMLEEEYEVLPATSVATALAQLGGADALPIGVILLDCLLPNGNVADVLAAADLRSIPVVMISGDPNKAVELDGSRPFLLKPFTIARLLSVLDSARR